MANIPEITDQTFEAEVLKSTVPFLLDFSATWCGPCKIVGPVVEELGKEYAGKLKVGMMDIEKSPKTSAQFTIMSVPTLLLFQGGAVKEQMVGAVPKKNIVKMLSKYVGAAKA
jgi:thioredoxin 1